MWCIPQKNQCPLDHQLQLVYIWFLVWVKQVSGPATSRICSCSLNIRSVPNLGSLPFRFSCCLTSSSSLGTSKAGSGGSHVQYPVSRWMGWIRSLARGLVTLIHHRCHPLRSLSCSQSLVSPYALNRPARGKVWCHDELPESKFIRCHNSNRLAGLSNLTCSSLSKFFCELSTIAIQEKEEPTCHVQQKKKQDLEHAVPP